MDTLEKELPNVPDAERAILAGALLNPALAHEAILKLCADDFYQPTHRAIFSAIREMQKAGQEVDPILLAGYLRNEGISSVGLGEINNLTYGVPHRFRLDAYIKQVKEKAWLRACMKTASEILACVNDGGEHPEEIAQRAAMSFDQIAQKSGSSNTPLITSYAEFMQHQYTDGEVIAFHASRGEIVLIQSITNQGKTTMIRNSALALATGGELAPVVERGRPRTVLLLNFEGAGARLQRDLEVMTRDFTSSEIDLVRANLFPVHAPVVNGEPLTLSRHLPLLQAHAQRLMPDVIIIDTASAAFNVRNENDNAEIQGVMKALTYMARKINSLVKLVHHIGKAKLEEGRTRESAHRGRGASAWSDFATSIFNLEADVKNPAQVILECAKRKDGEKYERVLTLNRATRWFSMSDQVVHRPPAGYDIFVETMRGFNRAVKRQEINAALSGRIPKSTITRYIGEAIEKGHIIKERRGLYRFQGSVQMLIPIGG
jgi:RecA-family ATPase